MSSLGKILSSSLASLVLLSAAILACPLPATARNTARPQPAGPVAETPGTPLPEILLVYENRPNPPRLLGEGTAIDWKKPGLTLELFRMVEEPARVRFRFKRVPWKRGLYLVENGLADGIFHSSFKEDRLRYGAYPMTADGRPDPSRSIFTQSYVLYVLEGSGLTWDGHALGNRRMALGVTAGYSVIGKLSRMKIPFEEAKTQKISLGKLLGGRIDAFVGLENMVDHLLVDDPARYAPVKKLKPPFRTSPYYLMFSKSFAARSPELAERVWSAIAAVRESPTFKARELYYAR